MGSLSIIVFDIPVPDSPKTVKGRVINLAAVPSTGISFAAAKRADIGEKTILPAAAAAVPACPTCLGLLGREAPYCLK